MDHFTLQGELFKLGTYPLKPDGDWGPVSRSGLILALAKGPDTPLSAEDISRAATALLVPEAAIRAVASVEAAGAGFVDGLPKVLPEPHRFSRATGHRFDRDYPALSYPTWDKSKYPRTQAARYEQLARMVGLDVDAGLSSASYGAFQIMAENHSACGYATPWAMVYDLSLTEGRQLAAFVSFLKAERLDAPLRRLDFDSFAEGYNGTAWRTNDYGNRLRAAYKKALS